MTDHPDQPDRSLGLQDNTELLHRISGRLADRFAGIFAAETVERHVFESYTALARTAKVSAYLPATTEHFASDRFNALAESKGAVASEVPEVLFVSRSERRTVPNGRRPAHHRSQGRIRVRSAGSLPAAEIDPAVVTVMAEMGGWTSPRTTRSRSSTSRARLRCGDHHGLR
jgi:arsenate reductase